MHERGKSEAKVAQKLDPAVVMSGQCWTDTEEKAESLGA